jgi:hypothetical protein
MKPSPTFFLAALLFASPAFAKHGHGNMQKCYVEEHDVRVVREYYQPRHHNLPPGLAKKYERTGTLPPGWEKKVAPLPVEVERQLVVLPPGYQRGYVNGTIVVYAPQTHEVIDIVAVIY